MSDTDLPGEQPPNPRAGRQRFLVGFLQAGLGTVAIAAVATLLLHGRAAHDVGNLMVALLIVVPAVRVVWLLVRWLRLGDRRYASVAAGLLAVMVAGALIAS